MNTKMKTKKGIGIALAVLMVFAMAAIATAYVGDHPLTVYDSWQVNGEMIFITDESGSQYTEIYGINGLSQPLEVDIPPDATVKEARLYNYYTWSKTGVPAEATLTITGLGETETKTCLNPGSCTISKMQDCDSGKCPCRNPIRYGKDVVQYWDIKNPEYGLTYRNPSGTFAWDVTDIVTGSGTYTATIENADETSAYEERFCTYGFGLLVVYEYENPNPGKPTSKSWMAEGADILYAGYKGITSEDATTSALFHSKTHPDLIEDAELCIVSTAINKEGTTKNVENPPPVVYDTSMVYFNGNELGTQEVHTVPPDWTLGSCSISVNCYPVTGLVEAKHNLVEIRDIQEYFTARNAFLKLNCGE